ncbi:type II restriction endonuclease [Streptobacillus moniliformis]|uniref:type II restriction endonuclease n=1 Tax=Streptobacillus moniliformis TaxID=34105 RepID=UPI0001A3895E|nr:type II restriction endonuclease [Streptobacillus moniliformis]QXW66186.1 type II restriction endonuclease [Streptobacillus moniliformis]SQA13335.1 Type-2 restriction enzyme DpnII [Streptobacillus moniliformis]
MALNILNTLIGKEDIESRLKKLIKEYPEIVTVIPILIAVRGNVIKVADIIGDIEYSFIKKEKYSDEEIEKIVSFVNKSGFLKIIRDKNIKNLVDYTLGVEVGLDTNARKNRSGKVMENLIELYIKSTCDKYGFKYLSQATVEKIKKEFGKEVSTDKADRHFDFVVDTGNKIYIIEVNYYSNGGSKLKSVAGEFSNLFSIIKNEETGFIWITDGEGWLTSKRSLLETFNKIDYVINIEMINSGLLEEILVKRL